MSVSRTTWTRWTLYAVVKIALPVFYYLRRQFMTGEN